LVTTSLIVPSLNVALSLNCILPLSCRAVAGENYLSAGGNCVRSASENNINNIESTQLTVDNW
jgi:hypothetical protein